MFIYLVSYLKSKINKYFHNIKAVFRKFCLFVAISVWKPGIGIIWNYLACVGCELARLQRGWI